MYKRYHTTHKLSNLRRKRGHLSSIHASRKDTHTAVGGQRVEGVGEEKKEKISSFTCTCIHKSARTEQFPGAAKYITSNKI